MLSLVAGGLHAYGILGQQPGTGTVRKGGVGRNPDVTLQTATSVLGVKEKAN